MRSINKVILIGNLTRDPELKQTASGQPIVTFGIGTDREIVAWARLAEICHKYLRKGKLVYIEGYLKTRSWDTPEGVKKFRTEIVANDLIMLEKRPSNGEDSVATMPMMEDEHDMHSEEMPPEEVF